MKILIKKARIFDSESNHNGKRVDILVENGVITQLKKNLPSIKGKTIKSKNLCISPGWLDIGTFNGEPGFEHREDLHSLKVSAAMGGFIALAPFPTMHPAGDTRSQIEHLVSRNDDHAVKILPIGALTKDLQGKELAEIYDMAQAGISAFSDGFNTHLATGQIMRVLFYLKGLNGLLIYPLLSKQLSVHGQIHEGKVSAALGVEGIPIIDEELDAYRIVLLSKYTKTRVHVHNISSPKAARLINAEKSKQITSSVAYKNLIFSDEDLRDFSVDLKVLPPLRSPRDRQSLIRMIERGQINVINSNHVPLSEEEKDCEFGAAPFGAIGLETCFSALNTFAENLSLRRLVECLSQGSYEVLGLKPPALAKGETAALTLFDPDEEFSYNKTDIHSKSFNSPFIGQKIKGRIIGIINGNKSVIPVI